MRARDGAAVGWCGLVVLALLRAGAACSSVYGEDERDVVTSAPDAAAPDAAAPDGGDAAPAPIDGGSDAGLELGCPSGRYDGFDDQDLRTPFWSAVTVTSRGSLTIAEAGASAPGSLLAAVHADGGAGQAFLGFARGELPLVWSFCLSFALRVPAPTDGYVYGPRIWTGTGNTNSTIAVVVRGVNVHLAFYNDGCPDGGSGCAREERPMLGTLDEDGWTVVQVSGEFTEAKATVTTRLGSDQPQTRDVTVPMFGFASSHLHVGVTSLAAGADNADFLIDDVRYWDTLP